MLPLYAGLRRNEVKTLRWSNLVLGESGGLLRIHAAVNKNRKEQALPLHHELVEVLQQHKPADCKTDDLVLVNGVPKMKEFDKTWQRRASRFWTSADTAWIIMRCGRRLSPGFRP